MHVGSGIRPSTGQDFLIKIFLPETRKDGRIELQSLVIVPNIPRLNPEFLLSDIMAYVMFITTSTSDGACNPGGQLGAFRCE